MSQHIVEIIHREEFSSAHRLVSAALTDEENRALYGPCYTLHGHNYAVEVTVRGPVHPDTGMVMDLNRLMVLMQEHIVSEVDHKYLNEDVPYLAGIVTTAENLAIAFWQRLQPHLAGLEPCLLHRIRVYESRMNFADYHGPAAN
jgi:6-pyruvoyltetrahydropterin/6-carboxytetrahydropterin synthase